MTEDGDDEKIVEDIRIGKYNKVAPVEFSVPRFVKALMVEKPYMKADELP
jgi:hypothetical protein